MKYKCKDNDVIIENKGDEIRVWIKGEKKSGKTIIGLNDLRNALDRFLAMGQSNKVLGNDSIKPMSEETAEWAANELKKMNKENKEILERQERKIRNYEKRLLNNLEYAHGLISEDKVGIFKNQDLVYYSLIEIDFDGHVKAMIETVDPELRILSAVDGRGNLLYNQDVIKRLIFKPKLPKTAKKQT